MDPTTEAVPAAVSEYMRTIGARGGRARKANLSNQKLRQQATKASRAAAMARRKKKRDRIAAASTLAHSAEPLTDATTN